MLDQVSYPYKTTGKFIYFVYFNIYSFRELKKQAFYEWDVASIPQRVSNVKLFLNSVLLCFCLRPFVLVGFIN
jgi:hypothetical protein